MNRAKLEQEIAGLEIGMAKAQAANSAHDTNGAHQARILEIEDELTGRRSAVNEGSVE